MNELWLQQNMVAMLMMSIKPPGTNAAVIDELENRKGELRHIREKIVD